MVIGVLLLANIAAVVIAFKPFGGSADEMRSEQAALRRKLGELERRTAAGRQLVNKVEAACREGDEFTTKYIMDMRTFSSTLGEELNRTAKEAGVKALPSQRQLEPVEGSDSLYVASISGGYEGSYASLKKFVQMLDRSPRFLIIENMSLATPLQQSGQVVTVSVKLDAFVRGGPEGAL
jgi:hypothetical protein